jgi:hypothetical protein
MFQMRPFNIFAMPLENQGSRGAMKNTKGVFYD